MKRITFFTLIISLLIIWGCNKDQSPMADEQTLNEQAIQNIIADVNPVKRVIISTRIWMMNRKVDLVVLSDPQ